MRMLEKLQLMIVVGDPRGQNSLYHQQITYFWGIRKPPFNKRQDIRSLSCCAHESSFSTANVMT